MKIVLDPRPYRTFSAQITFDIGWRHEPVKMRGALRKGLEELIESIKIFLPRWFEISYVMDSEYSSVVIFGTSKDQEALLKVPEAVEMNMPDIYEDLNASLEIVAFSGSVKKDIAGDFLIELKARRKPKIVTNPRRFIDAKNLSRVQKHFLSYAFLRRGGEVFLEVSRRGDRIHYGRNIPDIDMSLNEEKEFYKSWILKKWESTVESVKLLTLMNVFSKETIKIDEIFRDLSSLNEEDFLEAIRVLKAASRR